jgi:hypothetical protein
MPIDPAEKDDSRSAAIVGAVDQHLPQPSGAHLSEGVILLLP